MSDATITLANPLMKDIGPPIMRAPQSATGLQLPEGTVVVSADSHWEVTEDIFQEYFPEHLKDQAPRVWFDKYWRMGYKGEVEAFGLDEKIDRTLLRSVGPGVADMDLRIEHMGIEGVAKEIVFPQSLLSFIRYPKLEIQENMYRAYNRYVAESGKRNPGRFFGVGVFSNWWDPEKAESAMQQIVDLGLKAVMVPISLGKGRDGQTVHYGDPVMERFWDVVAESGLPVAYHIGENPDTNHRGGIGTTVMVALGSFRLLLPQLIFGGVFDRHPDQKVVFTEGGIAWVPPVLQDAEMTFDTFGNDDLLDKIDRRPSEYWHHNCYATFQNDLLGLSQLDIIGADRVMWGSDYPHAESGYGFMWDSMKSIVDATTPANARKILGGTAMEVYKL
jgi:predicted TIM-barrel fold metal-dependent hydrolase